VGELCAVPDELKLEDDLRLGVRCIRKVRLCAHAKQPHIEVGAEGPQDFVVTHVEEDRVGPRRNVPPARLLANTPAELGHGAHRRLVLMGEVSGWVDECEELCNVLVGPSLECGQHELNHHERLELGTGALTQLDAVGGGLDLQAKEDDIAPSRISEWVEGEGKLIKFVCERLHRWKWPRLQSPERVDRRPSSRLGEGHE
jgi:hypothetical protein